VRNSSSKSSADQVRAVLPGAQPLQSQIVHERRAVSGQARNRLLVEAPLMPAAPIRDSVRSQSSCLLRSGAFGDQRAQGLGRSNAGGSLLQGIRVMLHYAAVQLSGGPGIVLAGRHRLSICFEAYELDQDPKTDVRLDPHFKTPQAYTHRHLTFVVPIDRCRASSKPKTTGWLGVRQTGSSESLLAGTCSAYLWCLRNDLCICKCIDGSHRVMSQGNCHTHLS
jgi:hypothetical protein